MLPEFIYLSGVTIAALAGGVWALKTERKAMERAVARQKRKIQQAEEKRAKGSGR